MFKSTLFNQNIGSWNTSNVIEICGSIRWDPSIKIFLIGMYQKLQI